MLDAKESYGVKVGIISPMDYDDFHEIITAIQVKAYKVTMSDNGWATCTKERDTSTIRGKQ